MKKMLMVATVPSMIGQFNMNNIQLLQEMGYEVHVACDFTDASVWTMDRVEQFKEQLDAIQVYAHQVDFSRSFFKLNRHVRSYKQLKKIVLNFQYKFIHCHTPIAGAIARLVCNNTKTKCIYTAHGFHFYKGAPLKYWLLFYPIEWICSWMTDVLITINQEDYKLAKEKFHAKRVEYIHGVGIDLSKFNSNGIDIDVKRSELGVNPDEILLLSVGELNRNKNHEIVIRAIHALDNPRIKYFVAGKGDLKDYLENLIGELRLESNVKLLGYRNDVAELYQASDLFIFPSKREGLPVALMEAMASKVPVVCSRIRGNEDLVKEYMFEVSKINSLIKVLKVMTQSRDITYEVTADSVTNNYDNLKSFSLHEVYKDMNFLYSLMQDNL